MNKLGLTLLLFVLLAGTESCNLWRRVTHRHHNTATTDSLATATNDSLKPVVISDSALTRADTATTVLNSEKQRLIQGLLPIWNRTISYSTFSGKAKVHFEGKGDKQDFTANIHMERDKRIWVSITALGLFEAARALITPDSIIVIDRLHHTVQAIAFAEAGKLLPVNVDFSTLQRLIIGDVLQTGDTPNDATLSGDGFSLHSGTAKYDQQITYNRGDSTIRQQQLRVLTDNGTSLMIQYGDYGDNSGRKFSSKRVMNMTDKGEQYLIEMDFNKADFDVPVEFSFSIPSRYERK